MTITALQQGVGDQPHCLMDCSTWHWSPRDTRRTSLPETVFRWNLVAVEPSDPEVSFLNRTRSPSMFPARVSRCRVWALPGAPKGLAPRSGLL